jgi:PKD domain/Secretion system C-terminal sorting domain
MKMKRTLLLFLWLAFYAGVQAQTVIGRQNVDQYPMDQFGDQTYGLTWLPPSYAANPTKKYPLIIFLHGTGEAGTGVAGLNTLIGAALPQRIAGGFNPSAVNPVDGQTYEFIVVSPQAGSWSYNYDAVKYILPNVLSRYHVDLNRIYLTGLSAGGDGSWTVMGSGDANFIKQFSAVATASSAGVDGVNGLDANTVLSNLGQAGKTYGIATWAVTGDQDGLMGNSQSYINNVNAAGPSIKGKYTDISVIGHSAWNQLYDPAWRSDVNYYGTNCAAAPMMPNGSNGHGLGTGKTQDSLNVYEWFLLYSKAAPAPPASPVANAGSTQSITLPTNNVTLDGTGSTGTITSWAWTRVSGPNTPTIAAAGSSSTSVTGLIAGTYVFQLSLNGGASTASVTVTVNPAAAIPPAPVANAGSAMSITLPTSNITLDGTGSTGAITLWSWTRVSGPNNPTIVSSGSSSTSVTGLIEGTYVFQLSLNGGISVTTVSVTVNAAAAALPPPPPPPAGCGVGHKYTMVQNGDSAVWQVAGSFAFNYQPGDTIVIPHNPNPLNYWAWITFKGLNGAPGCPIVIINDNSAQTLVRGQVQIDGCSYIKFTGTGQSANPYGFKLEWDPQLRPQAKGGIIIFDRSKNVEVGNVDIHNVGTGIACLTDNNCDQTLDYPNWILDSMVIHDTRIVGVWNEGMYWGNTSPDNANYDWRADQCDVAQPATTYSLPMKNGYTHIYNMIIDSTGRGGIQLGNVGGTNAVSEINNNVVTHSGLSQDDAQGTAISIGLYTKAYIHDNTVRNTYTWGIASLGGNSTNVPIRVENNHIDSSGYLRGYPALSTTSKEVYDPRTEPQADDAIAWAYAIEIDTKPRFYTQASGGTAQAPPGAPYGTAVKGQDSTQFWVKNNVIGRFKGGAPGGTQPNAIQIHDDNPGVQHQGNIICNNTSSIGGSITVLAVDGSNNPIPYANSCTAQLPPTVNAGPPQTITLPTNSVVLAGTATGNNGATITSVKWTQFSGPTVSAIASPNATGTSVSGLAAGTYIFQLTATDNNGLTGSATVTITVNAVVTPPANQAPQANAGTNQTITLPINTVTLTGTGTDADGTVAGYAWTQVSGPSTSAIVTAGQATTTVNNLVQGVYTFKLTVTDNQSATGTSTMTVTVNPAVAPPANQAPQANAGTNQTITLPINTVTLTGTGTDADGTVAGYAWTQVSGPSTSAIVTAGQATTTVNNLVQGVYTFKLTVTDNQSATGTSTMTVTVNPAVAPPANQAPQANAGSNQIITLPTNSVTLTGTGTDADGTVAGYAWTQVSGPSTSSIATPGQATTAVNNLIQGTYTFRLTVTDNQSATGTSTMTVTVKPAIVPPANQPPQANAGPNQIITLPVNTVTFTGTGTDPDGTVAGYSWTLVSGPAGSSIATPGQAQTAINNLVQGTYTFQLSVTDNQGATATDQVNVTVNAAATPPPANQPPQANAGPNQAITLPVNSVTLAGTGTDADGTVTGYSWTLLSGPAGSSIVTAGQANTIVNNLVQGTYTFQLTVTDNQGATDIDQMTVTVNAAATPPPPPPPVNQLPVSIPGADMVITLPVNLVTLFGSGTDADGTIAGYSWTQLSGPSTSSIATPGQAQTVIHNLVEGVYTFQLTVTDNQGGTGSATMTVTVNAAVVTPPATNQAPVANAGADQTVAATAASVGLDGSASYDPDGTISQYAWVQISGAGGVTITNSGTVNPTLFGLQPGVYVFELTVTDNQGATATDQVTITVSAATTSVVLVANAGKDITVAYPANTVTLDGSASYAQGANITSYRWTQLSGPGGIQISDSLAVASNISQLVIGDYVFKLTVTDDQNASASDTVHVRVVNTLRNDKDKGEIYPNPTVTNSTTIDVVNSARGNVRVWIHGVGGQAIQTFEFDKETDELKEVLDLQGLSRGVYFIKIVFSGNYKPVIFRLVKQ